MRTFKVTVFIEKIINICIFIDCIKIIGAQTNRLTILHNKTPAPSEQKTRHTER